MRKNVFWGKLHLKRFMRGSLALALTAAILMAAAGDVLSVRATTESEIRQNINDLTQQIDDINNNIAAMEDEQDILEEEMEDLNAEIINTMTTISLKEDEIAEKETEIADKENEITQKESDIEAAETEYEAAKDRAEQQYEDTVARVKKMYQQGDTGYMTLLLEGSGLSEMLNRMDFVEGIYEYDREKLTEYQETQQQVLDLWNQLEEEKILLEDEKANLETAKAELEAEEAELEEQKSSLNTMLAKKKQQSDNYDAEIKKARQEASVAKTQLKQEQAELKRLQSENKSTANSSATSGSYTTTDYTSVINNASGSDLGKNIAKYACQFIGNPYVAGGTSLTNGADCSGFTYRIYADFGYSIPRTSTQQRSAGTGVSYSEAQPGDLICYSGHVALYIGGGLIVHASTAKSGIKVSNAQYREILAVRRII